MHQIAFALERKQLLTSFSSSPAWLQQQTAHQMSLEKTVQHRLCQELKSSERLQSPGVRCDSGYEAQWCQHLPTFPFFSNHAWPWEWLGVTSASSFFCTPSLFECTSSLSQLYWGVRFSQSPFPKQEFTMLVGKILGSKGTVSSCPPVFRWLIKLKPTERAHKLRSSGKLRLQVGKNCGWEIRPPRTVLRGSFPDVSPRISHLGRNRIESSLRWIWCWWIWVGLHVVWECLWSVRSYQQWSQTLAQFWVTDLLFFPTDSMPRFLPGSLVALGV